MEGWMYILECANGSYYTGSTTNLELRLQQHQNGEGANHTKKHLPVKLVYFEKFSRIDQAFYREKQVQGWSRKKKEALIEGNFDNLKLLSMAYRDIYNNTVTSSATSDTVASRTSATESASATAVRTVPEANNTVPEANNTVPEALEGTDNPKTPF